MEKRRVLEPGLAGDPRYQPVARNLHLVDHFNADGVERFPRVVREEPGEHEPEREQREQPQGWRQRNQCAQRAQGSPHFGIRAVIGRF